MICIGILILINALPYGSAFAFSKMLNLTHFFWFTPLAVLIVAVLYAIGMCFSLLLILFVLCEFLLLMKRLTAYFSCHLPWRNERRASNEALLRDVHAYWNACCGEFQFHEMPLSMRFWWCKGCTERSANKQHGNSWHLHKQLFTVSLAFISKTYRP